MRFKKGFLYFLTLVVSTGVLAGSLDPDIRKSVKNYDAVGVFALLKDTDGISSSCRDEIMASASVLNTVPGGGDPGGGGMKLSASECIANPYNGSVVHINAYDIDICIYAITGGYQWQLVE